MDVYFATWIFYGTTSGSGSGSALRRRSGCADPSSRACAIRAGSLRHARPQHRMSVHDDFCSAKSTVAMAPATTVIKPPSSLMLNGSIDMAVFSFKASHMLGNRSTVPHRGPPDTFAHSCPRSPPGHVERVPHQSTVAHVAQNRGACAEPVTVVLEDHATPSCRSHRRTCIPSAIQALRQCAG